jgi:hypothetical protein
MKEGTAGANLTGSIGGPRSGHRVWSCLFLFVPAVSIVTEPSLPSNPLPRSSDGGAAARVLVNPDNPNAGLDMAQLEDSPAGLRMWLHRTRRITLSNFCARGAGLNSRDKRVDLVPPTAAVASTSEKCLSNDNLTTAKVLGLQVPEAFLLGADEVIE